MEQVALQDASDDFQRAGATLATISPQTPEHVAEMKRKHDISFTMLSDEGNQVAEAYGLRHGFPDDLKKTYKSLGIDLPEYNGDNSWTLPMPARLIIDPQGTIRHIDADPDYTSRPDPADTLARLEELKP